MEGSGGVSVTRSGATTSGRAGQTGACGRNERADRHGAASSRSDGLSGEETK